jgi:flagellar protein FlaF
MYRFHYSQVVEDGPEEARRREREAFDHALSMLVRAQEKGAGSVDAVRALHFLQLLWSILIDDLCNAENDLTEALKAGLISIGLWVAKEIDALRSGRIATFADLIEINQLVRDGLR